MATLSRNARHKARQKRTISQAFKALRSTQADLGRTHMTLLSVLAQAGGEITLETKTLQALSTGWEKLSWVLAPKQHDEGTEVTEWVLKLVTTGE